MGYNMRLIILILVQTIIFEIVYKLPVYIHARAYVYTDIIML